MATWEWLRFFEDAGIPPGPALGYAVAFVDNRIHKNMLLDLTKELMKELGITVVGDIIAILRHAKVVHRQEMCRAASESLQPEARSERGPGGSRDHRDHRDAGGAAGRMITNSLSRDPAPRAPRKPPGAGISVTVANGAAETAAPESPSAPPKRRRVTAEMEGKYVISLPKGTTARSRKILQLQAASGLGRTSVFERLGAEAKAAAAAAGKPSGVFSRLGDALDDGAADGSGDAEALPYAGVLKKRRECSGSAAEAQDGAVSSSVSAEFRPAWGCGKVSSSSGEPRGSLGKSSGSLGKSSGSLGKSSGSWGESSGSSSVFRRLGRKPD